MFKQRCLSFTASLISTAIFALKWVHCLPFSGLMPVVGRDGPPRLGTYLIYAREPFSFPLGLIKGLSFPFQEADVMLNGAIPLFAMPFKFLSRLYAPFSEFYYFVLVELLAVFLTAYFAYRLLEMLQVKYFLLKLLGSVLCSLSFPLLSFSNHDVPEFVIHFPIYLAFAYFYIRLSRRLSIYRAIGLLSVFFVAALADPYVLFGICVMASVCVAFNFINFIVNRNTMSYKRLVLISLIFLLSVVLSIFVIRVTTVSNISKLEGGLTSWNFTCWGGRHVADAFSLIIPEGRTFPGGSLPASLGFPMTTDKLQVGQRLETMYIGTTAIGLVCIMLLFGFFYMLRNFNSFITRFKLRFVSNLYITTFFSSPVAILGSASFVLYVLSLGYVIHAFGHRIDTILFTPGSILPDIWPVLFHIRTLNRLAVTFPIYVIIWIVARFSMFIDSYIAAAGGIRKIFYTCCVVILIGSHIYEVRGYLRPVRATEKIILNIFNEEEIRTVRRLLRGKKALFIVPDMKTCYMPDYMSFPGYYRTWDKISYALTFYSGIPANIEFDARIDSGHKMIHASNIDNILKGKIKMIAERYGDIAIASHSDIATGILNSADVALDYHRVQDIAILTLRR